MTVTTDLDQAASDEGPWEFVCVPCGETVMVDVDNDADCGCPVCGGELVPA